MVDVDGGAAEMDNRQEANLARAPPGLRGAQGLNTILPTSRRLSVRELESLALNADEIRLLNVEQASYMFAAAMFMLNEGYA